eukprot:13339552-Alexandrium_andersonii.AAC.1
MDRWTMAGVGGVADVPAGRWAGQLAHVPAHGWHPRRFLTQRNPSPSLCLSLRFEIPVVVCIA